ncbi:MAG TPA: ABC transporter substrate-binding protein [Anaeromyxobacter sp.]|nr:ABC transporter substrate-binding protein [Anaeromyxobacter sp.]
MKTVLRISMLCFLGGAALAFPAVATAKQTLVVYACSPEQTTPLQKIMNDFGATNDVEVKLQVYPSDEYMQVLTAAMNAGSQIDVVFANGQDLRFMAQKGIVRDLTQKVNYKDRFHPAMLVPFTFSDHVYGLPTGSLVTSGVYYNKEIFAKVGITRVPENYEQFLDAAKKIRAAGISPIAMGGGDVYMWPMWFFETFAQTTKNHSFERTVDTLLGKAKFTDKDYLDSFTWLGRFGKDALFVKGVNGTSMDSARSLFLSGKAAMFYGGTWELNGFYQGGMSAEKMGILRFPVLVPGSYPESTGGPGTAWVVYSKIDSSRADLAYKLIDYATSDTVNAWFLEQMKASNSVNRNVMASYSDDLVKSIATEFAPHTTTFLDWIWPPEITKAFQQQIQAVIGGQTTPEKATEAIQKTYDDLSKGGYKFYN